MELPFCGNNKIKSKHFLKKFHCFTKDRFEVAIKWKTRQVKTLFPLKSKTNHPSCVIYKGTCSCVENKIRWEEHNGPTKMSEPAKHLKNSFYHKFN